MNPRLTIQHSVIKGKCFICPNDSILSAILSINTLLGVLLAHYLLFVKTRASLISESISMPTAFKCKVASCLKAPHAKGYCNSHYAKYRRWGTSLKCSNDKRGKSEGSKKNLIYRIRIGNIPWNKGKTYILGNRVDKIEKKCFVCDKVFFVLPSDIERIFCSKICSSKIPKHTQSHSEKSKILMSIRKKGKHISPNTEFKRNPNTPELRYLRSSNTYAKWRKQVFERDNYTCQLCGIRGGKLEADHIKPFSIFPKLRFVLKNGRTLCKICHRKTETFGKNLFILKNIFNGENI